MQTARCVAIAAIITTLSPAAASEPQDQWIVTSGTSRVVEVGPYSRFLVVDPERIAVERDGEGRITVTGLQRTGLATVHLFGDAGVRTLVFDVRIPSRRDEATASEPIRVLGPEERFLYSVGITANGTADQARGALVQRLSYSQDVGDTSLDAAVSFSIDDDLDWRLPFVYLQARTRAYRIGLGDTHLGYYALPSPPVRGAWAAWTPTGPLGASLAVVGGWHRDPRCCALVSTDLGSVAALRGGYAWRSGEVGATVGIVHDASAGVIAPTVRLAGRFQSRSVWGWAEAARSGAGYGGAGSLAVEGRRFTVLTTGRFLQRGYLLLPGFEQGNDHLSLTVSPTVTLAPALRLRADLGWTTTSVEEAAALHVAYGTLVADVDPTGPHGFSAGLGHTQTLTGRGTSNAFVAHHFRRGSHFWLDTSGEVELDDRFGLRALRIRHGSWIPAGEAWQWGLWTALRLSDGFTPGSLQLLGRLRHLSPAFSAVGNAGVLLALHPQGTKVMPTVDARATVALGQMHSIELSASVVAGNVVSWSALVRYELRWSAARSGASPLALAGRVACVVFDDVDGDGVADPDEPGIAGVPVRIDRGRTEVTDAEGRVGFRGVLAGPREVLVEADGWRAARGNVQVVRVDPLRTTTLAVPMEPGGRMVLQVFLDRDGDGARSDAEPFVAVEQVTVTRESDGSAIRAAYGHQRALLTGVRPGWYLAEVDALDLEPGLVPVEGGRRVELVEDEQVVVDLPVLARRAVGGRVVLGVNRVPVAGVEVVLSTGDHVRTDAEGRFLFRRVPEGEHTVVAVGAMPAAVTLGAMPQDLLDLELIVVTPAPEEAPPPRAFPLSRATSLTVLPAAAVLGTGDVLALRVRAEVEDGTSTTVTDEVAWSSSNPAVVTVERGGRVVGVGEGSARVVGTLGELASAVEIDVVDVPVVGMSLSHTRLDLTAGATAPLQVWGIYVDGRVVDITDRVRWDVSPQGIVTVDQDGTVTAQAPGQATVRASYAAVEAFPAEVRVNPR